MRDEDKSKEQLMAKLREARGQLAELRNLAVGIAHELNNPIGIILSRIELMLLEAEDQPAASNSRADLQVLHRHAQRLSQITHGLLSFGRERQRTRMPIDLNEVVEETLLLQTDPPPESNRGIRQHSAPPAGTSLARVM